MAERVGGIWTASGTYSPGSLIDATDRLAANVEATIFETMRRQLLHNIYREWGWREPTWEERLAKEIQRRSLRGRLLRLRVRFYSWRWRTRDKISLIWDVLRDKHDCYY